MKYSIVLLCAGFIFAQTALAQNEEAFAEQKIKEDKKEFSFIGYYFMRGEMSDVAPTNEFLKGQVVGRLFGGNSTADRKSVV